MATTKQQIIDDFKALSDEDQKEVQNAIYKRPDEQFDSVSERYQQRTAERLAQEIPDEEIDSLVNSLTRF